METKLMKSELLYIEEHLSCQNYMTTIETGFKYLEFDKNTEFEEDTTSKNYLLFFLKGDFTITCNQFHNRSFHAGEMILIPRSSRLKGIGENGSSLLSMFFDMPEGNCDKLILQSLSELCNNIEYDFSPIRIHYPLTPFLEVFTGLALNELLKGFPHGFVPGKLPNHHEPDFFILLLVFLHRLPP